MTKFTLTREPILLERRADQQRRSAFLRYLVISLIALLSFALLLMIFVSQPAWYWFVAVGASLALNIVIFYLNRREYIQFATHLFCHNFNLLVGFAFFVNLIIDKDETTAAVSGNLMALTILLAGMLISRQAIVGFALLNTLLIPIPYFLLSGNTVTTLRLTFPFLFFAYLLAVISWLYQGTLNRAQQQLRQAELIQRDLDIARKLQQQLFPEPPALNNPQITIAARSEPARETSGDFYDFIKISDHEVGIVVADVAGKSIPAALIMTMTRSTLRSEAQRYVSPAQILERTNQVLLTDEAVKSQMITAFYGLLDTQAMTFHFANAGHIAPALKRNGSIEEFDLSGIPLGVLPDPDYQEAVLQLQPGDQLILSSDGLVETVNPSGEIFGFERMLETIRQANNQNPQQLLQEIWGSIETFRKEAEQNDDMTMVVISVEKQAKNEASFSHKQEILPSTTPLH